MKKIIKAFEKWFMAVEGYTEKEALFCERTKTVLHEGSPFYAGYKAGQKAEREKQIEAFCENCPNETPTFSATPGAKEPTHEEIMTLWWKVGDHWYRVKAFHENGPSYDIGELNRDKGYFIGRKSSIIPPEK